MKIKVQTNNDNNQKSNKTKKTKHNEEHPSMFNELESSPETANRLQMTAIKNEGVLSVPAN
jgi:hypothetical protein